MVGKPYGFDRLRFHVVLNKNITRHYRRRRRSCGITITQNYRSGADSVFKRSAKHFNIIDAWYCFLYVHRQLLKASSREPFVCVTRRLPERSVRGQIHQSKNFVVNEFTRSSSGLFPLSRQRTDRASVDVLTSVQFALYPSSSPHSSFFSLINFVLRSIHLVPIVLFHSHSSPSLLIYLSLTFPSYSFQNHIIEHSKYTEYSIVSFFYYNYYLLLKSVFIEKKKIGFFSFHH